MKKIKLFDKSQVIISTVVFLIVAIGFVFIKPESAQAINQKSLTGSCGIAFNKNYAGYENLISGIGQIQEIQVGSRYIGTINFDSMTFAFNVAYVRAFGSQTKARPVFEKDTGSLTIESFDSDTGVYMLKGVIVGRPENLYHISILPVNGSNTFLVNTIIEITGPQPFAALGGGAGVCQRI